MIHGQLCSFGIYMNMEQLEKNWNYEQKQQLEKHGNHQ